jgi:hypothetical protein
MKRWFSVFLVSLFVMTSCAGALPVVRTIDDMARDMCAKFFGEKNGISLEDAARTYCQTREDLDPWIGPLLEAQKAGEKAAAKKHGSCDASCKDAGAE